MDRYSVLSIKRYPPDHVVSAHYYEDEILDDPSIEVIVNPATITLDLRCEGADEELTLTIEEASDLFDKLASALEKVGERNAPS